MSEIKILALSSSRVGNSAYLENAVPFISNILGGKALNIAFLPFASVENDYHTYANMVKEGLKSLPHLINLAEPLNAKKVVEDCDAVMVGGGNTFKLLHDIYAHGLFNLIVQKINTGTPYIGWSAGANISGLSISTTNDMPIIQPQSFKAFGFLPFQLNPHYLNLVAEGYNGETRDQRLTEFLKLNPTIPVIGLPEGTALQSMDRRLSFMGIAPGVLFTSDASLNINKSEIDSNTDLAFLL